MSIDSPPASRLAFPTRRLGMPPLALLEPAPRAGRSRVDLMWHEGRLGLRSRTPVDGSDWSFAPPTLAFLHHLEPPLPAMIDAYQASLPPHGTAQVRLRTSPEGRIGAWIDMSREAMARLLVERDWLLGRVGAGWLVEMGQRGEGVLAGRDGPLLAPATPATWLPGRDADGGVIPLECHVASFTQPGPAINAGLLASLGTLLDRAGIGVCRWAEWGSGYGNLTAWLATRLGSDGCAVELDGRSRQLLVRNAVRHFPTVRLEDPEPTRRRSMQAPASSDHDFDILVIDPPRPGFSSRLDGLADSPHRPAWVLSLHCDARGLDADGVALARLGFAPDAWIGVDAFPGTPYLEVITLWKR
ncbi:MAG TPA: hypothetical protein VF720_14420 [Candidatus Eisenbacteria bacterium]